MTILFQKVLAKNRQDVAFSQLIQLFNPTQVGVKVEYKSSTLSTVRRATAVSRVQRSRALRATTESPRKGDQRSTTCMFSCPMYMIQVDDGTAHATVRLLDHIQNFPKSPVSLTPMLQERIPTQENPRFRLDATVPQVPGVFLIPLYAVSHSALMR